MLHAENGTCRPLPHSARMSELDSSPLKAGVMPQSINVNPTSEHELYLKLFVTNGGGW